MAKAVESPEAQNIVLAYREIGSPDAKDSILFIHGAFSSGGEWDIVTSHLSANYHLLLPDLPGHGESQGITPFSKELSARLLADIIRERAAHGKAHVIGLSLGAAVAIKLASKYPELVNVVFVSGYGVFPVSSQSTEYGLWLSERVESSMPRSVVRWLMDGADIRRSTNGSPSLALCRDEAGAVRSPSDKQWPPPWPARTLIVAAGKAGIVPSSDSRKDATRLRDTGRMSNRETRAYTHPLMRHPWSRQAPELFAETARKWIEDGEVPDGFEEL